MFGTCKKFNVRIQKKRFLNGSGGSWTGVDFGYRGIRGTLVLGFDTLRAFLLKDQQEFEMMNGCLPIWKATFKTKFLIPFFLRFQGQRYRLAGNVGYVWLDKEAFWTSNDSEMHGFYGCITLGWRITPTYAKGRGVSGIPTLPKSARLAYVNHSALSGLAEAFSWRSIGNDGHLEDMSAPSCLANHNPA
ncbi:hypothetical protein L218DRAFT_949073 [Marasmius fiardii PR-910]|nr:hypothetical protein L218DRAFT_949073 [Marasmius fiardii PR-910]